MCKVALIICTNYWFEENDVIQNCTFSEGLFQISTILFFLIPHQMIPFHLEHYLLIKDDTFWSLLVLTLKITLEVKVLFLLLILIQNGILEHLSLRYN